MITRKFIFPKMNNQGVTRHMFRATCNESGAILVMAMLLMIVIVLLVAGVMTMTTSDLSRVANYQDSRRAFYITEAGVEAAKALVRTQNFTEFLLGPDGDTSTADAGLVHDGANEPGGTLMGTEVTIDGNKYSQVSYDGGTYSVRVFDNQDEATNDPYTDSDNIVVIESIGVTANNTEERITAAIRKYNLPPGEFPAAVTLVGPIANMTANGSIEVDAGNANYAWDLNGYAVGTGSASAREPNYDTDCASQNAVATEDSTWSYQATDWNGKEDQFSGKTYPASPVHPNDPDVGIGQTGFTAEDAEFMQRELKPFCHNCWTGKPQGSGAGDWILDNSTGEISPGVTALGTIAEPLITYIDGNVRITSGQEGAGVMIIDGNLSVVGEFHWAGIVLIGTCDLCWGKLGSSGTSKVYGAMVVGNSNTAAYFDALGNALIYYSCDGVAVAENVFGSTFKDVGWNQSD